MAEGKVLVATEADLMGKLDKAEVELFTFVNELWEPFRKFMGAAWEARGKLAHDASTHAVLVYKAVAAMPHRSVKVISDPKLAAFLADTEDPEALAFVVAGTGGSLCLGSTGAVVCGMAGSTAGAAAGAVPALLTFGFSIPVFATVGGTAGLLVGAVAGGSVGFVGSGIVGYGVAARRRSIRRCIAIAEARCQSAYDVVVVQPVNRIKATKKAIADKADNTRKAAKAKSEAVASNVKEIVADRRVQVSAVSAGAGAAGLGTAGAACGTIVGGAGGAIVGLVPALFTFGLSIPIGAVIGGGAGLCTGAAAGATVGFTGGGAAGAVAYTYRTAPGKALTYASEKATGAANAAKRIMGCTGGTNSSEQKSA
eukprot:CAMPEP_0170603794 /NCGR_PEP_ID=MMETSP0224-20130122/19095_1 /TAXON_ID=285029 /ORGANISM="Togula jolla, Strain CCCM 725" /LENGTH=367 /DNA_ID=CAMNT_0010928685 /DNA_START=83 /DNA_END=1186 /DNA_ORIENTATION=+